MALRPHLVLLPIALSLARAIACAAAEPPRPLMRDFIGLNGHTVQFKPDLYRPVAGFVRDYHPVEWDLGKDTAAPAPFPFAKNRVDWNKVYGSWRDKDWTIDACLMFESIKRPVWKDVAAEARAYGTAFAREFGPSGARKLVGAVEIGNEPGDWSDEDYSTMFRAMAEGLRAGDPKLQIATCNLTTGKSGKYEKSVTCIEKWPQLFDVLNIHSYAQLEGWPTWKRSFPEDPKLKNYLGDIEALAKWRDAHAVGKPIWLTEFGYDSTTKPQETKGDFAKWVGVNDTQQAQWLVRSLLVFSTMPIERAYLYFFDDNDEPHVHGSSGITRHFQPKPSYYALSHLQSALGDYRFQRVVTNEPGKLRVQEYQSASDPKKSVWVAWSPTGDGQTIDYQPAAFPGKLVEVQHMPLSAEPIKPDTSGAVKISVGESPVYLFFARP